MEVLSTLCSANRTSSHGCPVFPPSLLIWLSLLPLATPVLQGAEGAVVSDLALEQVPLAGIWKAKMTGPLTPAKNSSNSIQDKGVTAAGIAAMSPATNDREWLDYQTPLPWSGYGGDWSVSDGEAIFRRRFTVPDAWLGQPLELHLGAIDDFDLTQVNGTTVGSTDVRQPGSWTLKRVFRLPVGLVHAGENLLCIRVFDVFGEGGLMGPKTDLYVCKVPPVNAPDSRSNSIPPVVPTEAAAKPLIQPGSAPVKALPAP